MAYSAVGPPHADPGVVGGYSDEIPRPSRLPQLPSPPDCENWRYIVSPRLELIGRVPTQMDPLSFAPRGDTCGSTAGRAGVIALEEPCSLGVTLNPAEYCRGRPCGSEAT